MSEESNGIAGLTLEEKRALVARLLGEKRKAKVHPGSPLVHDLISEQAARAPDAVALTHAGTALTYGELDRRANRLAHRLRDLGVGPDVRVGLGLRRSHDLVVALLATLKAGGAYVPIDPDYPAARVAFMLQDARAPILLTQEALRDRLPAGDATVVCVDSLGPEHQGWPDAPPDVALAPGHLAYVIYTSGSTGRPKGAMIAHAGLANYLAWAVRAYHLADGQGSPVHSSVSFDLTVTSLLAPLVAGRRVDLLDDGPGVDQLAGALRTGSDYSLVKLTPAHLQLLGSQLGPAHAAGRTQVLVVGGEQLTAEHVAFWRQHAPGTRIVNEYGPTETVVGCCAHELAPEGPTAGPIPIGRPIANAQMYVLDARMRPAPLGVAGELYIGGPGVGRGYLGRPALTAERFVPDPFARRPGARLYRTGDLGRRRPDGLLECLGRLDHQVKVRGYRIELGEVDAALAAIPEVGQVAVVAYDDASGEKALAAYLAPRAGRAIPAANDLRAALREALPEYMIPASFVALDALPLTANGKVDRDALPDPVAARSRDGGYVPPRGPVEEALVGLWGELLGVERVGVHDNFFDLGGHSLFATQLVARLRDVFAVEPSLRAFLEAPTVAGLARLIEAELAAGAGLLAPPIVRVDRGVPLPASFAQKRLWFLDQLEPGGISYNIPTAVRLRGELDPGALRRALRAVVERHEVLRTTFRSEGGVPMQVVGPARDVPMPTTDLGGPDPARREDEVRRVVAEEARRPFDLARGPIIRARLIRLDDREHVICVTMHHIASDGWSIGVLIREVGALYDAFRRGEPSPLPGPFLQYGDFAVWQERWLRGDTLRALLDYWSGRLAGVPALEMPTDRPRPAVPSGRGGRREAALPRELVAGLRALGRQEGATLYMAAMAAFQALLHRHTGQDDIAVGSPIAGRTRSELEGLIGFFVNTLVLRADLRGDPTFRELLGRVRREALGAYAHQDLPFEQLVGVLHPDRDPSRTPIFQAMLVLQNAPMTMPEAPGLEIALVATDSGTAKFDLTLTLAETADGMDALLEFNADLFDPATADRLLGHFRTLLEGIVADPDRPVSDLPMLTEAEQRLLLGQWDDEADEGGFGADSGDDLDALLAELADAGPETSSHD